jgi:hypothetical protein
VIDKDIFEDLFVLELANNHMGRVDGDLKIIPRFRRCARPSTPAVWRGRSSA